MPELEYGPMKGDELGAVARLIHHAFAGPIAGCEEWMRDAGIEHVRVVREGGELVACLLRVPMGQFFGGRSVRMLGIAGVAVAPEARGRGLARRMMEHAVLEAHAEGFLLAGLYASTVGLYRQVGFEQAGHRFVTRLPIHRIDVRSRSGAVRVLTPDDEPAIRACHARFASAFEGTLDRGPYVWQRVRKMREDLYKGFGIDGPDGGLAGYVYLTQTRKPDSGRHDVSLSDIAFTDPTCAARLLGFLSDFATVGDDVVFFGGPLHPLLSLLDENQYKVEKKDYWMTRVLDVAGAIRARGFPSGTSAVAALCVRDTLIPSNDGTWNISIADGRGGAERRAATDSAECDIRGLAPLYSGLYTARQAALLGWIRGSEAALADAGGVFLFGGTPWMSDMF